MPKRRKSNSEKLLEALGCKSFEELEERLAKEREEDETEFKHLTTNEQRRLMQSAVSQGCGGGRRNIRDPKTMS